MYNLNNYFLHIYHLIVAHYWNSFSISVNRYSLKWLPWRWPLFTWHLFTWKNLALYVDFITWLIRHFQIESRNARLLRDDIVQKAHFTSKKTETLRLSNLSTVLYSEGSHLTFLHNAVRSTVSSVCDPCVDSSSYLFSANLNDKISPSKRGGNDCFHLFTCIFCGFLQQTWSSSWCEVLNFCWKFHQYTYYLQTFPPKASH